MAFPWLRRDPTLTSFHYPKRPVVGEASRASASAKNTREIRASFKQDCITAFEGTIEESVMVEAISLAPMQIRMILEPSSRKSVRKTYEWMRTPRAIPPRFLWVWIWPFAVAGKPTFLYWNSRRAEHVEIVKDDGHSIERRVDHKKGRLMLRFDKPGKYILRLTAESKFAKYVSTRVVRVRAPAPVITVDERLLSAKTGQSVTFAYSVTDADEIWLGDNHNLAASGQFAITVAKWREEFTLKARKGTKTTSVKLIVVPADHLESTEA